MNARAYRILKVTGLADDPALVVITRDYHDGDTWAVIEQFPASRAGLDAARRYVADVQQRQIELERGET